MRSPARFQVGERDPGVHQRRHPAIRFAGVVCGQREAGEQSRDTPVLADVRQPQERGVNLGLHTAERGDRIDDHGGRFELTDVAMHAGKMHFEPVEARPRRFEAQKSGVYVVLKLDAGRPHVAHDLIGRFLERKVQATLVSLTACVGEPPAERGLARSGQARDQDARAAIEPRLGRTSRPGPRSRTERFQTRSCAEVPLR